MFELAGSRKEILKSIGSHPNETSVRIKTKPSRALFLHLIERTAVKEIKISAGLYKTIPKKVLAALGNVGVNVVQLSASAGRPRIYPQDKREIALQKLKAGMSAKKISGILNVPTTAIYYWKLGMKKEQFRRIKEIDST